MFGLGWFVFCQYVIHPFCSLRGPPRRAVTRFVIFDMGWFVPYQHMFHPFCRFLPPRTREGHHVMEAVYSRRNGPPRTTVTRFVIFDMGWFVPYQHIFHPFCRLPPRRTSEGHHIMEAVHSIRNGPGEENPKSLSHFLDSMCVLDLCLATRNRSVTEGVSHVCNQVFLWRVIHTFTTRCYTRTWDDFLHAFDHVIYPFSNAKFKRSHIICFNSKGHIIHFTP